MEEVELLEDKVRALARVMCGGHQPLSLEEWEKAKNMARLAIKDGFTKKTDGLVASTNSGKEPYDKNSGCGSFGQQRQEMDQLENKLNSFKKLLEELRESFRMEFSSGGVCYTTHDVRKLQFIVNDLEDLCEGKHIKDYWPDEVLQRFSPRVRSVEDIRKIINDWDEYGFFSSNGKQDIAEFIHKSIYEDGQ